MRETALIGNELIEVYRYRPSGCSDGPLLFVFTGYERNAEDYLKRARWIARRGCFTVFAPTLDRDRFPRSRYQHGGFHLDNGEGGGPDCMGLFLRRLITWARDRLGRPDAPYVLFGHSAGAQMLSRVTAYAPLPDAGQIVIANPSSYVAASLTEPIPFGFAGFVKRAETEDRLRTYLAQRITIYLGTDDVGDENLDESDSAMRQGDNRYERGRAVFKAAKQLAGQRGWPFHWRLVRARGIGHSSRDMLRATKALDALGLLQVADETARD